MNLSRLPGPIVIELTEAEATLLRRLCGSFSRTGIEHQLGVIKGEPMAAETHYLTNAVFLAIRELGL